MNKQGPKGISWCTHTWNPVTGCKHGCDYCYARKMFERFGKSFEPEIHPERLHEPAKLRKPSRIFVCSAADLFGAWVPQEWIDAVLGEVRGSYRHTFQFLTKNPERLVDQDWPDNAWVGATATTQVSWQRAGSAFRHVNAQVRFISVEPFLAPICPGMQWLPDWLIIGAQTGAGARAPKRTWVDSLDDAMVGRPVFHKRSVEKLMGTDYRRDFPR